MDTWELAFKKWENSKTYSKDIEGLKEYLAGNYTLIEDETLYLIEEFLKDVSETSKNLLNKLKQ